MNDVCDHSGVIQDGPLGGYPKWAGANYILDPDWNLEQSMLRHLAVEPETFQHFACTFRDPTSYHLSYIDS
ncbi:hypothetical protein EPI10_006759 [Gossypium australe]|uniref:Uncharacterized protein n=1 Tax=Gossypium australe TaxID=47621 RepID=A0A5B6WS04_9ROSI|nr:hypothetical protein EPI10_006759 [Gossypium australe]